MNPCFAAEKTLGKLAKWLRLLGFDTLYQSERNDESFFETLENDRILLTRTQLIGKQQTSRKLIYIKSDHLEQQLKQVLKELDLKTADTQPFSICLQCNKRIVAAEKKAVWGRVPDYIFETHEYFQQCPKCSRIYWPGSHTQRSLEKIKSLFE